MNKAGIRIRKLREERGLTQENMSTALGLTQSSYGRLEMDDSRLNVE